MEQVTFTDADVQKIADAVNFIHVNASFGECSSKKAGDITRHFAALGNHVKWMSDRVFEIKNVTEAPKPAAAKKAK